MSAPANTSETLGHNAGARIAAFAGLLRQNGFLVGLAESRDALAVLASPVASRAATLKPALRAFVLRHPGGLAALRCLV